MKLTTSKRNEYAIQWADTTFSGDLFMQMEDDRKLSEIAAEFEDLSWLKREDENQGDKLFDGFNSLKIINRVEPGVVILTLTKGAE